MLFGEARLVSLIRAGTTKSRRTLEGGGRTFDPALCVFDSVDIGRPFWVGKEWLVQDKACLVSLSVACLIQGGEPRSRKRL